MSAAGNETPTFHFFGALLQTNALTTITTTMKDQIITLTFPFVFTLFRPFFVVFLLSCSPQTTM